MQIRTVRPEEHVRLGELTLAAYRSLEGPPPDDGYAAVLADIASRAIEAVVLVAADSTGLLGGVTYVGDATNPYAEDVRPGEAGIRMLAVDPRVQCRGAGRALVEACIARARADGRTAVALGSTPWMPVAHKLYRSLGFVRVPARDWEPEPGLALLSFVLETGGDSRAPGTRPRRRRDAKR